jgi:23S rRNA (uracil1939-C5)-methyltransferase
VPSLEERVDEEVLIEEVLINRLNWAGLGVTEDMRGARCVPLTEIGERIEVRWRRDRWRRWIGERISGRSEALERARCAVADRCPGCTLRHLSPSAQQYAQEQSHLGAIKRLSERSLDDLDVRWAPAQSADGYRAKLSAQLVVDQGQVQALMTARWGEAISLSSCPVQSLESRALLERALGWLQSGLDQGWRIDSSRKNFYDDVHDVEVNDPRLTRITIMASAELSGLISLQLEASEEEWRRPKSWLSALLGDDCVALGVSPPPSVYLEVRPPKSSRHIASEWLHLGGPEEVTYQLDADRESSFKAKPPAWLPQTPSSVHDLRQATFNSIYTGHSIYTGSSLLLSTAGGEMPTQESTHLEALRVFELGCGVGVISLWLAKRVKTLIGVDMTLTSVEQATRNGSINEVENALFIHGDGRRALADHDDPVDVLLVHAMRRPLSGLFALAAHRSIPLICYLAPSAPALGRDLAEDDHYKLLGLTFLDQMPGTAQSMTIATLALKGSIVKSEL